MNYRTLRKRALSRHQPAGNCCQCCKSWSASARPKKFGLSKLWAKSQNIWAKKLRHF